MANVIDQDQQWLINCLSATLDPNQEVRSFAEASLNQASLQPGFGLALSKVAANRELPVGLRQLAAVLLKQFIKKHWQEGDELFEHPAVSNDEKAVIRKLLLFTLDDSHRKICTAISMAVTSIATYDWPEEWPELLPYLLDLMNNRTNMNGVHGGLRCLALLSGELDCEMIPKLVPALFPHLLSIVSSPEMYDKYLRTKALSVVYSCISMLGVMSGVYKEETSALVIPMLKPWMEQFSIILGHPVQSEDPDDWSIRMEVLKCMNQFFQNFPSFAESDVTIILQSVWQTFVSSLQVYVRSSIAGVEDPYEGSYDSDGADKSLDSFVIQLFEFLLTIVGSSKLVKLVKNNLGELVYYTIAFLQITEQQIHLWSMDSNQFVADEDDGTFSCRVSGALLLEEIVGNCGLDGINAIIDAAKSRFSESKREKASGSSVWWRIREAILFALASLAEQLIEVEPSGVTRVGLESFLEEVLTEDMSIGPHECPFLYARIFTSVAKFSSMIRRDLIHQFLHEAVKALGMDVPPPVKVGACRALSELLPEANKEIVGSEMMFLFSSLGNLLNGASDETLHLVLDTLQAAVKAGGELSASIEPILSPVILKMWASHVSDPFISIDLIEVLEAIKNSPGCIRTLASRILPYLVPILDKPQHQPDGLVPGSLDLLTMLLKNAPIDVVKAAYDACFDGVVRIILQTDDHSELQNATESLAAFVAGGKQEILTWGSGFIMKSLLAAASRLLDPKMESSGSFFVGSFILQLILHLPSQMAQHLPDLVAALVRRMQSVQIAGVRSSLILIFARLVHMSASNIQQLIDLLVSIPVEGNDNSFVYLMSEWTKLQAEVQGAYQIKVTTTALALLLATQNPHLAQISVQGQITKLSAGITTRSKGKLAPDQWTVIPLPAKILSLLADALIEIQEQVSVDDQDSECKSANPTAVSNSSLAISWLEETFPNLVQATDGGDSYVIVAHPCALFDASLALQGPLRRACNNGDGDTSIKGAECEGRAVSLLYNLISKDSVLVTAWSGGQLQIDALADEIQPVWNLGSPPRVRVDPNDNILGLAMICEVVTGKLSKVKLDQPLDHTVWLGLPPPLLRLAIVDLALPKKMEKDSLITMFVDKLMDQRIYALHNGGIDSIILHFLPFTSQSKGQNQTMRTPSVHPVLNTCQGDTSNPFPLCGFASLSDSLGYSWILGVTLSQECIVLEMKTWNLLVPVQVSNFLYEGKSAAAVTGEKNESERSEFISKDLLGGPKVVLLPQSSSTMRSVTADSIEGRSMLHQYFKLFHENYVEYAHAVYYELKQHEPKLKRLIEDQQTRLKEAQQKLLKVEGKQQLLDNRIECAIKLHNDLEERIHRLKNLPGAHKKPLSKAEREFKSTLDHFTGVELDVLHTSIDTLTARLRRFTNSSKNNNLVNQQQKMYRRNTHVQGSQISQLKSSLEKLSLLNAENTKKVKLVESTIQSKERNRC